MTSCSDELKTRLKDSLKQNSPRIKNNPGQRIPAAVMVPFVCVDGDWNLLFTKRTAEVAKHQGEISFPGGAAEITDTDLIKTALRETCEEMGIVESQVEILGVLEPVPTISNYCVLPVIAIVEWPIKLNLNMSEVEKAILIPVTWLMDRENWYEQDYVYEPGKNRKVIHYLDYHGEHLWGLTAMMTRTVLDLL